MLPSWRLDSSKYLIVASAYADAPLLAIALQQDKDLNSLHINSTIEWNRDDLHEQQKRADLEKKNIFYGKPEGSKIVRQYKVGDKNIKVEMAFPKKQQGRRSNESTRVELFLFEEERLFFMSNNFGQHSEEYTTKSKASVKFRPQSLNLYETDRLRLKITGVYGQSIYDNGVIIDKGLTFDHFNIRSMIDDSFMNNLASGIDNPPPNE